MNGDKAPKAITRDQEFLAAILDELRKMRLALEGMAERQKGPDSETTCGECGRSFPNVRALHAHMRVHKEG